MSDLGKSIKKARKGLGLSQKDFAEHLHISDKAVSSYEVGRAVPNFEMMKRIAKLLGKPIGYFDGDAEVSSVDLEIKLKIIEKELLEIKKLLKKRK